MEIVKVKIQLGFPARGIQKSIADAVKTKIDELDNVEKSEVEVSWKVVAHSVQIVLISTVDERKIGATPTAAKTV